MMEVEVHRIEGRGHIDVYYWIYEEKLTNKKNIVMCQPHGNVEEIKKNADQWWKLNQEPKTTNFIALTFEEFKHLIEDAERNMVIEAI